MNIADHFSVMSVDGTIRIIPKALGSKIEVLGCTVATNAPFSEGILSDDRVDSLVIFPSPEEEGLIAICFHICTRYTRKSRPVTESYCTFLRITTREGRPWLDVEGEWYPTERIGMIQPGNIEVQIDGRTYQNTNDLLIDSSGGRDSKLSLVEHGQDLFCKYLFGTASREDVLAAAETTRRAMASL